MLEDVLLTIIRICKMLPVVSESSLVSFKFFKTTCVINCLRSNYVKRKTVVKLFCLYISSEAALVHKNWVNSYVAVFDALYGYIKDHHRTGPNWNSKVTS